MRGGPTEAFIGRLPPPAAKSRVEVGRDRVHFSAVIAREAPRPQPLLPVIAAGLLVLAGFVALLLASRSYAWARPAAEEPYNIVVEGFRSGHVWLAKEAPPALATAANPYDFATYRPYLGAPWDLTDMSYFKGHLYAYFGVTPAVIVFWPFRVLSGGWLHQSVVVLAFCVLGYAVAVGLAVAARRRYFPGPGPLTDAAIALLLGSVTTLPVFLVRPGLYEVAISCGFSFTMLSLAALWNAWHRERRRVAWLAAASLCYGLAVGSRPTLLFGAVVLFVPAITAFWANLKRREPAPWARYFLAALVPISAVGVGLAAYNYSRFGDPLQFGHDYQLSGNNVFGTKSFGARFFWDNFRMYFLDSPRWHRGFPFVWRPATPLLTPGHLPVEFFFGALSAFPILLIAAAAPFALKPGGASDLSPASWVLLALFLAAVVPICCYAGATGRYMLDFMPALALLAVLGLLEVPRLPGGSRVARGIVRAALIFSIAVAWLLAIALSTFYRGAEKGISTLLSGNVDEAVVQYERLCAVNPDFKGHAELMIGTTLLGKGRAAEGVRYLTAATRDDPALAPAHFNLGQAFLQQGRFADAADAFRRAAALDPYDGVAEANEGVALFREGHVAEAISHENIALRIQPTLEVASANLREFESAADPARKP
jgi:tetratricopeptide (TPR) repeat protein